MDGDAFKNALDKLASQKSDKTSNASDGKRMMLSSPEAGNQASSQHGMAPSSMSQHSISTLGKSKRPPSIARINSRDPLSSASPYNSAHSNIPSTSRQNSAAPDQIMVSIGNSNQFSKTSRPGTSGYTNVHSKIPDSIPEGSREEKPGRLQAGKIASRMDKTDPKEAHKSEVTRREPEVAASSAKEETPASPKCMCCMYQEVPLHQGD